MIKISKIIRIFILITGFCLLLGENTVNGQCSGIVASYPYREDFESGTGSWTAGGTNTDWVMGTPSKAVINSAASGNNCWITGGLTTAFYNYGERSWVMSPCFDFSGLVKPMVTVSVFWDTEYLYDGANLQYSTDGFTWKTIGSVSEPDNCVNQNWYNVNSVTNLSGLTNNNQGWAGTVQSTSGSCRGGHGSGGWMEAKHCLSELAGQSQVIFRFIFGSGTTCNDYDGFAFDLFKIEETPAVPFTIARNCIASNVVEFDDAGAACHTFWNWNFGDPTSASNTSNLQSPQHTFTAPGKYTVTLYSGNECTPEVSATTDVYILFVSTSSTPETCVNAKDGTASVHVSGSPAISQYTWNTDPIQTTATAVGLSAGQYAVNITATNSCAADAHIDVLIGPDAFPRPDLGPDSTLCPGSFIFLDAGNYQSFLWQDSSALQSYVVEKAGLYTVRITNSAGCTGSDSIQISEDCLNDIVFPNAFTPNGDQVNDLFLPVGSEISNYNLSIYNRWGQLMYETNDQNAGWDGTLRGRRQEAAVYLFKAGYSVRSGDVKEKTGKLILIR